MRKLMIAIMGAALMVGAVSASAQGPALNNTGYFNVNVGGVSIPSDDVEKVLGPVSSGTATGVMLGIGGGYQMATGFNVDFGYNYGPMRRVSLGGIINVDFVQTMTLFAAPGYKASLSPSFTLGANLGLGYSTAEVEVSGFGSSASAMKGSGFVIMPEVKATYLSSNKTGYYLSVGYNVASFGMEDSDGEKVKDTEGNDWKMENSGVMFKIGMDYYFSGVFAEE